MSEQELASSMRDMLLRVEAMQAEIDTLKARSQGLPRVVAATATPPPPKVNSTRRKTLKRLGLAILGGAAAAATLGATSSVQAKVTANPRGALNGKVGMMVVPPGAADLTGTPPAGTYYYGLIASGDNPTTTALSKLPNGNSGVVGLGDYGVYGYGGAIGVLVEATTPGFLVMAAFMGFIALAAISGFIALAAISGFIV